MKLERKSSFCHFSGTFTGMNQESWCSATIWCANRHWYCRSHQHSLIPPGKCGKFQKGTIRQFLPQPAPHSHPTKRQKGVVNEDNTLHKW